MRLAERDYLRRTLALARRIPPHPVHRGFEKEGEGDTEGMIDLAGQDDRIAGAGKRAIWPS